MADAQEFITIADFTSGIHSDYHAQSGAGAAGSQMSTLKNGAATIENTYRCVADPSGILGPLPGVITPAAGGNRPTPPAVAGSPTNYLPNHEAWYTADAICWGPISTIDGGYYAGDANPEGTMVYIAYTLTFAAGGGSANRRLYHFVRTHLVRDTAASLRTPVHVNFKRSNAALAYLVIAPAGLDRSRTVDDAATFPAGSKTLIPTVAHVWGGGLGNFQVGAVGATDDTDIGIVYNGGDYATAINSVGGISVIPYAAPTALPTDGVISATENWQNAMLPNNTGETGFRWILAHQGRLIILVGTGYLASGESPTGAISYIAPESMYYTDAQLLQGAANAGRYAHFVEENPTGYGAFAALSANTLLLIKNYGGGVLVRSDVENAQIDRLPKVEPTYGLLYRGVVTPLGFIYCSRNGIFLWDNGDTSQHLSPQLEGYFYNHLVSTEVITGIKGRLAFFDPFVAVPNNYLLDTRTGAWWRLDLPTGAASSPDYDAFNCYDVSPQTGHLYAFPYKIRAGTTDTPPFHIFRHDTLASTYSWQSQPLLETRDRRLAFNKINLVAQRAPNSTGTCTVAVTLTGINEDGTTVTPVTETFTLLANSNPQHLIKDVHPNFTARYVQVRIVATAATSGPAPKVHSVALGISERQRAVRS